MPVSFEIEATWQVCYTVVPGTFSKITCLARSFYSNNTAYLYVHISWVTRLSI